MHKENIDLPIEPDLCLPHEAHPFSCQNGVSNNAQLHNQSKRKKTHLFERTYSKHGSITMHD